MKATVASLAAMIAALSWTEADAARAFGQSEGQVKAVEAEALLLAQAREVEIVIDTRGRELIVDAFTGEVLAVREPRTYRDQPAERRMRRDYELGRYPVERRPLGERLDRELEILLGEREPPSDFSRDFRPQPLPDEALPQDRFPDAPRISPENWRDPAPRDTARPRETPRSPDIQRAPLGEPDQAPPRGPDVAAVPPQEVAPSDQIEQIITDQPDVRVAPALPAGASEDVAKIQIVLDRAGLSPGVIDGRMGDNVNKALSAYREKVGNALRTYDKASIEDMLAQTGGPAFTEYTIQPTDAAGPFVASIPADYGEKAQLERLGFTSVAEMLAEKFHMDEGFLKAINPGVDFSRPGTIVRVANVGEPLKAEVARIIADKSAKQVRAYDASGRLVVAYPATIGSQSTPSPTGTVTVERIALNPEYTYNPKINFQQGANDKVLTIPPGPNGPVGSVWIALSKPTYGIHGTPDPSKIGKTYSNGCVRLTNWDAAELAKMVKAGVTVEFVE